MPEPADQKAHSLTPLPTLAYEQLPRPDVMTVHDDESQLDIVVPPAARRHQIGLAIGVMIAGLALLADLVYRANEVMVQGRGGAHLSHRL